MLALNILLAVLLLLTATGVVAFRNPLHSAMSLIANMLTIAGFFALLEAHFLAVVQVIVYAGAVMVLVVFVIMLLNVKEELPKRRVLGKLVSAVVVGGFFLVMLIPLLKKGFAGLLTKADGVTGGGVAVGSAENIGRLLFSDYVFPFEIASVLIMAALVGAVMISRTRRKAVKLLKPQLEGAS